MCVTIIYEKREVLNNGVRYSFSTEWPISTLLKEVIVDLQLPTRLLIIIYIKKVEHFRMRTYILLRMKSLLKTLTIFKTTYIVSAAYGNIGSSILITSVNIVTAEVRFRGELELVPLYCVPIVLIYPPGFHKAQLCESLKKKMWSCLFFP